VRHRLTAEGDVVANDPASSSDDVVRNVYKRAQFETIWLRTSGSTPPAGQRRQRRGLLPLLPGEAVPAQRRALAVGGRHGLNRLNRLTGEPPDRPAVLLSR